MTDKTLHIVFGDQLSRCLASLRNLRAGRDVILMVEVMGEVTSVRHHKQKIILVISAMRHFAQSLRAEGQHVDYVPLDDPDNTQHFTGELQRALQRHSPARVAVTSPSEWRVHEVVESWREFLGTRLTVFEDDRFICRREEFRQWAGNRKSLRMEFFYREMRLKTGLLMRDAMPVGNQWNFDTENRKRLPSDLEPPSRMVFAPDQTTRDVKTLVETHCADHYGTTDGFAWAVTRDDALRALDHFVRCGLPSFGLYQDALKDGEDFVFHSALSPYINLGLLLPREVCDAAEEAFVHGRAPLNAVEGFIRQIIGWREFVSGVYWLKMPDYQTGNFLQGQRKLPSFFWWGEAPMRCLAEALRSTRDNAYAHHIQRLMVIGNFAILAGIAPREIEEWFLVVYADAFEWVELPNVHGMVMHADGGLLASKPYVASGAYINRMSDHCRKCQFDPALKTGPKACPYNFLYWNFLETHKARLSANPRMALAYKNLEKVGVEQLRDMQTHARQFLESLA